MNLGHECSRCVPLHGNPRTTGTFVRAFINFVVPLSRAPQKQLALFGEVASMFLHAVTVTTVPDTYLRVRLQSCGRVGTLPQRFVPL
jgi:hypothetical protein